MNTKQSRRLQYRSLAEYRRVHGLSQREAALRFNVSQGCWQKVEAREHRPRTPFAKRLVRAGIPLEVLMGIAS